MKINITRCLVILALALISCTKSNIDVSDKFIKEISTVDNEDNDITKLYIPENATNLLYLKLDNNKMLCMNTLEVKDIYDKSYKKDYKTFYLFLKKALNQKIDISINHIERNNVIIFDLENNILNKSNDLIKKEYLKKIDNDNYYFAPGSISLNQKQTVLYKMFIDNYLISFDDYSGNYMIKKYQ
ncbi:hypothetical protein [Elizabethkingia meningoseptica]|uniref:hypothetical protein n=1 Tax=Elizabethkingia meningoseptica TaxID=238 RepID=UPI0023B144C3|nr:hypothetical protein [Elizabethkingia meningoseptica]MDE5494230.1 hypothetical protein [Elizabethkingia meningoseptica]